MNIIGGLLVDLVNAVYRGLLVKTYWAWFVMSTFPDAPAIGIPSAIGLSLLLTAMIGATYDTKNTNTEILAAGLASTSVIFVAGWILKQFL
jgi:hypothetical protein